MPLHLIPLSDQCPALPGRVPQTPALPGVLSKSRPFLKMDCTLQTPYAQFSFIILISKYLGRAPALASAVILVPANMLCSPHSSSLPSSKPQRFLPTWRRTGIQGGKFSQRVGACGLVKMKLSLEAVGGGSRQGLALWVGAQGLTHVRGF